MEKLYKLKDRLMDVLENDWAEQIMRKQSIGLGDIEMLYKLTDAIKNLNKICMMETGGYSEDGEREAQGSYDRGSSRTNRGEHWVRGHYSRNGDHGGDYSSRRDGPDHYSRDNDRTAMMEHLEAALNSANEQDRANIMRFMRQIGDN